MLPRAYPLPHTVLLFQAPTSNTLQVFRANFAIDQEITTWYYRYSGRYFQPEFEMRFFIARKFESGNRPVCGTGQSSAFPRLSYKQSIGANTGVDSANRGTYKLLTVTILDNFQSRQLLFHYRATAKDLTLVLILWQHTHIHSQQTWQTLGSIVFLFHGAMLCPSVEIIRWIYHIHRMIAVIVYCFGRIYWLG